MNLWDTTDYRAYVRWRFEKLPQRQRELKAVCHKTGINVSVLSQVLNGRRELGSEQAYALGRFLDLSEQELEYFCTLVALGRGESPEYRSHLMKKLSQLRDATSRKGESRNAAERSPVKDWSRIEEHFFSVWYYSAVYLMTSIPSLRDAEAISTYLKLPRVVVKKVLDLLIEAGLCKETPSGEVRMNPGIAIRAEETSLQDRHRLNWRLRASQTLFERREEDLFFTHALTVSRADAERIRGWLAELRSRIDTLVPPSKPDVGMCLNLDWFVI